MELELDADIRELVAEVAAEPRLEALQVADMPEAAELGAVVGTKDSGTAEAVAELVAAMLELADLLGLGTELGSAAEVPEAFAAVAVERTAETGSGRAAELAVACSQA